ncbi:glycerophosphotransferase [soil metagenome]
MRIGFLFNHDAAHQVAHSAGIMTAYARANPDDTVVALVSPKLRQAVESLANKARVEWVDFRPGAMARRLAPLFDRVAPFSRKAALPANLDVIAGLDALVATERTCLWAKRKLGLRAPKFIYVPHGAGDRGVTYHPELSQFDLLLVPGRKWVEAGIAAKLVHAGNAIEIIGYPKFDAIESAPVQKFFPNDNPVFVYNPHFDPWLSSWYDFGPQIIDWFASHPHYNLIFAPHVMLFRKRFHWSLEYRTGRFRPAIPASAKAPNILIDIDSPRLFDMSYMRSSDAYIGDASSQIYEFMSKPRPAFFVDPHGVLIHHWQAGPVVHSIDELTAILPRYEAIGAQFSAAQQMLFAETFDPSQTPASERAATAIASYMAGVC